MSQRVPSYMIDCEAPNPSARLSVSWNCRSMQVRGVAESILKPLEGRCTKLLEIITPDAILFSVLGTECRCINEFTQEHNKR